MAKIAQVLLWHAASPLVIIALITGCVMAAQVPRAPGSCCLAFSLVTDAEGEGKDNPGSSWSVYGEVDSQAALHIMPEWAEVSTFPLIRLRV